MKADIVLSMSSKKPRPKYCSDGLTKIRRPRNHEEVVLSYKDGFQRRSFQEMRWYASRPDFSTMLEVAVLSRTPDGKRHPHQRRLPEASLREAHERLAQCDLTSCETFDELHDQIQEVIGDIEMIGELAVYDIASRIGAFLKLKPERIYLHRGTRAGAAILGIARRRKTVEISELPPAFHDLSPHEIEDCLCIFKGDLLRIRNASAATASR